MKHNPRSPTLADTGSIATYNSKNRMDRLMDDLEVMKRGHSAVIQALDKYSNVVSDSGEVKYKDLKIPIVFVSAIVGALLRIGNNVKEGN